MYQQMQWFMHAAQKPGQYGGLKGLGTRRQSWQPEFVCGAHMTEEKNQLHKVVILPPCKCHAHPHKLIH